MGPAGSVRPGNNGMTPIEIIKDSVSVRDACEAYGIEVNRAGFACCPFHGEKTPSMKVYDGSRGFYCFGCHVGGDVIAFVQKLFGLSVVDAEKRLSEDFSLGLEFRSSDQEARKKASREAYKRRKQTELWKEGYAERRIAYDKALTEFARLDRIIANGIDRRTGEIPADLADALRNMETAQARLYEAEWELNRYAKTRPGSAVKQTATGGGAFGGRRVSGSDGCVGTYVK